MHIATRIIVVQCLIGLVISALWMLAGPVSALAALCGAGIAVVPAAYMRWRMTRALQLIAEPRALVGQVQRGQIGKFALTCVLFALTLAQFPQEFLPVMSTFVACLLAYIVGGLLGNNER